MDLNACIGYPSQQQVAETSFFTPLFPLRYRAVPPSFILATLYSSIFFAFCKYFLHMWNCSWKYSVCMRRPCSETRKYPMAKCSRHIHGILNACSTYHRAQRHRCGIALSVGISASITFVQKYENNKIKAEKKKQENSLFSLWHSM